MYTSGVLSQSHSMFRCPETAIRMYVMSQVVLRACCSHRAVRTLHQRHMGHHIARPALACRNPCRDESALEGSSGRRGDADVPGAFNSRAGRYTYRRSGFGLPRYGKPAEEPSSTDPFTPAARAAPKPAQMQSSPGRPQAATSSAAAPPSVATELFPGRGGSPSTVAAPQKADAQLQRDDTAAARSEAPTEPQSHQAGNGVQPTAVGMKARRVAAIAGRSSSPLASRPRFTTGSGRHTFDKALAEDL